MLQRLCTVYQRSILPIVLFVLSKQYCTSNKALHNTCTYTISKNVKFDIQYQFRSLRTIAASYSVLIIDKYNSLLSSS